MNSLRIGCDRIIRWSITSGGEPYNLSGKNIRLKVSTRSTQFYVSTDDFSIDGNKIIWLFRGKDQKHLGPYTLTYIENEGMDDMLTFDRCNAFNFVACSCQESRSSSKDMEISNIDLSSEIKAFGVKLLPNLIPLTYQELFFLRASSGLIPGAFYRITDYVTTTSQTDTQSAGHQFDIVVLALTEDILSERAWACHHDGDKYFQNSHLEAWQIWYCLDNDTSRFAWAVPTSSGGRGVIYRMIDENNNDCPYDFKNIRFRHPNDVDGYLDYYYTFSTVLSGVVSDHSLRGGYCYGNKIGFRITDRKQQLNNIVFINTAKANLCHSNSFGKNCYSNSFGNGCYSNTFGNNCQFNAFGTACYYNSFGDNCHNNSFGNDCCKNSFAGGCDYNTFDNSCNSNTFGNSCNSNTFGNNCKNNSFSNSCYSNDFGDNCRNNSFDDNCYQNLLGNGSYGNNFKNNCHDNSFGIGCGYNSFGNSCKFNIFGESTDNIKSYYRYIIFDNGNSYINLNCTSTTSSSNYYQNVRIGLGVNNKSTYKTITDSNVGQTYETLYKPADSKELTA